MPQGYRFVELRDGVFVDSDYGDFGRRARELRPQHAKLRVQQPDVHWRGNLEAGGDTCDCHEADESSQGRGSRQAAFPAEKETGL
jgi:hypothetical protein